MRRLSRAAVPPAAVPAAALLAAALLAAALLAAACARPGDGAAVVRRGGLGALPRESVALLAIEVRALGRSRASSPWMRDLTAAMEEGPFREVRDRFGVDAFDAIERVGLAVVPQPDNRVAYGIVAEGAFDREALLAALGGAAVTTVQEGDGVRPDLSVAVLADGNLAVGPRLVLEAVRNNAARRGDGLDANEVLLGLLARVRPSSQIWGAVDCRRLTGLTRDFAAARGLAAAPLDASRQVGALLTLAFQGTVGRTVDFQILAEAEGEEGARNVADAARGLLAISRMAAGQDAAREWLKFLDGVTIEQTGPSIALRGSVPEETLAAIAAKARAAAGNRKGAS
jgi:hypothetical protein